MQSIELTESEARPESVFGRPFASTRSRTMPLVTPEVRGDKIQLLGLWRRQEGRSGHGVHDEHPQTVNLQGEALLSRRLRLPASRGHVGPAAGSGIARPAAQGGCGREVEAQQHCRAQRGRPLRADYRTDWRAKGGTRWVARARGRLGSVAMPNYSARVAVPPPLGCGVAQAYRL